MADALPSSDVLVVAWTCEICARSGIVSGPRVAGALASQDPLRANCYFCQATVMVQLPEGLSTSGLRVEGEYPLAPHVRCAECGAAVQGYWDERGTPLARCVRAPHHARLPAPPVDPLAWDVLLHTREEKIERRRTDGGWTFRSRSSAPTGWRRSPYKKASVLEVFEPEPGRPLAEVFRDIRAEHLRLREEERRRRAPRVRQ